MPLQSLPSGKGGASLLRAVKAGAEGTEGAEDAEGAEGTEARRRETLHAGQHCEMALYGSLAPRKQARGRRLRNLRSRCCPRVQGVQPRAQHV